MTNCGDPNPDGTARVAYYAIWRQLVPPVCSCAAVEQTSSSALTAGRDIEIVHKTAEVALVLNETAML